VARGPQIRVGEVNAACGLVGFDLAACVGGIVSGWFFGLPGWAWIAGVLLVIGLVWRLAGWPGLVALGGVVGYFIGRHDKKPPVKAPPQPEPKRRKTLF